MNQPQDFSGYLPVRVLGSIDAPTIRWLDTTGISLTEPFFENLWTSQLEAITDKVIDTGVDLISSHHGSADLVAPNGFIFHMSRCGSTLLTNMLRRISATIAHSEPYILDPVFLNVSEKYLKKILELFGSRMNREVNYALKLPSYATINIEFFTKHFPDVPKLFLYRDPAEVLMSNLKDPDQSWIFEERIVAQTKEQILGQNTVIENLANALLNTCDSFISGMDESCFCMNYTQLTEPQSAQKAFEFILERFGFNYNHEDVVYAMEALKGYSKNPILNFNEIKKHATEIPGELRQMAYGYLGKSYDQLEALKVRL